MTTEELNQWKELRTHSEHIDKALERMSKLAEALNDAEMRRYVYGAQHMQRMLNLRLDTVAEGERWVHRF